MRTIAQKRAEFMKDHLDFLDLMDPSGENSKKCKEVFGKMTDAQFDKYIRKFFDDDKDNFYLEIIEFERSLTMENIKKTADRFKIPLFEYVSIPYMTKDPDNIPSTPEPVLVGYIHEKRMQQMLLKKNAGSIKISKRNPKTGQVVNEDKNARISDPEVFSLTAIGADNALREFFGPRADDLKSKHELYNNISRKGYSSLDELSNDPSNKVAINSLDIYFAMQGIRTNLVSPMDVLPKASRTDD
jgi:hypothetical protein